MDRLSAAESIMISQKKEWGEIITGFETKNKYQIMTQDGSPLYFAGETGGNFLMRMFLKGSRPFEMTVMDSSGKVILKVNRPFRFFFPECTVSDGSGKILGQVKWNFAIFRKKYTVLDKNAMEIFRYFGPALKPWTFKIMNGEQEVGIITKKWSGLFKEAFSDADNFGIQFPPGLSVEQKALLLGSVFLIDFVHFENKN